MTVSSFSLVHGDLLTDVAQGLARSASPWELPPGASGGERQYAPLVATDVYDAWLIYWPPSTGLEPHDHGGSSGAFAVVSGTLDEDTILEGHTVTRRVRAGDSVAFDGSHVHAVTNRGSAPVTSVHVYSPPLRAMGYYRRLEDGSVVLDRVDDVESPPAARGLHRQHR
jgi:mannose-6-phosphate isomerase-like protein (cupin superfamily)